MNQSIFGQKRERERDFLFRKKNRNYRGSIGEKSSRKPRKNEQGRRIFTFIGGINVSFPAPSSHPINQLWSYLDPYTSRQKLGRENYSFYSEYCDGTSRTTTRFSSLLTNRPAILPDQDSKNQMNSKKLPHRCNYDPAFTTRHVTKIYIYI